MQLSRKLKFFCSAGFLALLYTSSAISAPVSIQDVAKTAIENNPEVEAKWHEFLSSGYEIGAARAGYKPKVDLNADYGAETRDYGPNRDFTGGGADLTITQMLYDGFETSYNVERFENSRLVRYYELIEAVENVALNSFLAYEDVMRNRELVSLATQNFRQHQKVFNQIEASSKAGVARRADFEQAKGRLALAESNLLIELSNLHDVSARYLRIVGELPKEEMNEIELSSERLPASIKEVMEMAYKGNPSFHAAIRNIQAAESSVKLEKSNYQPRLDLNGQYKLRDYDDVGNSENQQSARVSLQFSYNLYKGGRDAANISRSHEQVNVAKDLRHKACIDMRQNLQISHNDISKLRDQLPILDQHRQSSNLVRTAYNDQFDIGQRTLLDLLDAENEFFQSSRAYTNAKYDFSSAQARTLAGMGELLAELKIARTGLPTLNDLGAQEFKIDPEHACPAIDIADSLQKVVELDTDGDGVPDHLDLCPDTPKTDKVDEKGCSIFESVEVRQTLKIEFGLDSTVIADKYKSAIQELADFLNRFPATKVEIQGHASKEGPAAYNLKLSQGRADAIAKVLISEFDIPTERVTAVGYGFNRPLIDMLTQEAFNVNRRSEAVVTAITKEVVER